DEDVRGAVVELEELAASPAGEEHAIGDALGGGELLQPADLGRERGVGQVGVAADDHQPGLDAVVAGEARDPPDGVVDSLAGYEPADVEEDALVGPPAERAPGERAGDGPELRLVEAARDDAHAGGIRAVEPGEVLEILRALGDDRVGIGDDTVLDL